MSEDNNSVDDLKRKLEALEEETKRFEQRKEKDDGKSRHLRWDSLLSKKSKILIVITSLAVFLFLAYNMAVLLTEPTPSHVAYMIPFTNVPVPLVNHYKINNLCQLINAELNHDPIISLKFEQEGFGSNVQKTYVTLIKDELSKTPGIAGSETMLKTEENKLLKQAFDIEIKKLEDSFELNPSFEKEFTNDFWYANTYNGEDLTPEMVQEFNISPPTMPTVEQLQNDPECKTVKAMLDAKRGQ